MSKRCCGCLVLPALIASFSFELSVCHGFAYFKMTARRGFNCVLSHSLFINARQRRLKPFQKWLNINIFSHDLDRVQDAMKAEAQASTTSDIVNKIFGSKPNKRVLGFCKYCPGILDHYVLEFIELWFHLINSTLK